MIRELQQMEDQLVEYARTHAPEESDWDYYIERYETTDEEVSVDEYLTI